MVKRSKIYESETVQKLRDPEYAEGYLNSAIFSHDTPIKIMIDKFGHAELGERIAMAAPNVARRVARLREDEDIKLDTLQLLMKGFGLSLAMSARKMESA